MATLPSECPDCGRPTTPAYTRRAVPNDIPDARPVQRRARVRLGRWPAVCLRELRQLPPQRCGPQPAHGRRASRHHGGPGVRRLWGAGRDLNYGGILD